MTLFPGDLCCVIKDGTNLFLDPQYGFERTGVLKTGDVFMILSQFQSSNSVIETVYLVMSSDYRIGWSVWRKTHFIKCVD